MKLLFLGAAVVAMNVAIGAQGQPPFRVHVTAETINADGFALSQGAAESLTDSVADIVKRLETVDVFEVVDSAENGDLVLTVLWRGDLESNELERIGGMTASGPIGRNFAEWADQGSSHGVRQPNIRLRLTDAAMNLEFYAQEPGESNSYGVIRLNWGQLADRVIDYLEELAANAARIREG